MNFVLTLVSVADNLGEAHVRTARAVIEDHGRKPVGAPDWLAAHKAVDIALAGPAPRALLDDLRRQFEADAIDVFTLPVNGRRKKLLLADMDSTIVTGETLDELAAHAGIGEKVADITARAMEGQIDFHGALRERVALLRGLPQAALEDTLARTVLSPGAKTLVATMKNHGARCVLVSGGFTFFTGAIATQGGFDAQHGNTLEIVEGALTGAVRDPILDKNAKLEFLREYCMKSGVGAGDAMTIGDGANDIPMLKGAGFGVGYRPKSAVAEAVPNLIVHGDLTAALYAQGYKPSEWLEA